MSIALAHVCGIAHAQTTWLTGKPLRDQLERPTTVTFSKTPLRESLESFSRAQRVAYLLDRRVDPGQKVELAIVAEPLDLALKRIAAQEKLKVAMLNGVAYFGPPQAAHNLRTLAAMRLAESRELSAKTLKKVTTSKVWHWDELTTPQDLLAQLETDAGLKIHGAEQIPHDLWAAADLPALSWIDRLSLVAIQFDLTFAYESGGQSVRLVKAPEHPTIIRNFPVGGLARQMASKWSTQLPEAKIHVDGGKVIVDARAEDMELIERATQGAPGKRQTVTAGKEVYKLAVENVPLDRLLDQLSQKLNLKLEYDQTELDRAGISLKQLVSLKVENASLEELLDAALKTTRLTYRRTDRVVTLSPAPR